MRSIHYRSLPILRTAFSNQFFRSITTTSWVYSEKTFQYQSSLPRLPIPTLQETTELYLQSIKPLVQPNEYKQSESLVHDFIRPGGVGEKLQTKLIEHDQKQPNSWLEDFWLKYAYLIWRCPTMLNVNWWCQFVDPVSLPRSFSEPFNDIQLLRAAYLISYTVQAQEKIEQQTWSVDKTKKGPLCMHQYSMIFGTTRIPEVGMDRLVNFYPTTSKHIVVMLQEQLFSMSVQNTDPKVIFSLLKSIRHATRPTPSPPIGVLTSENRDTWAKLRTQLLQHEQNRSSMEVIDKALFVVSLDDQVHASTSHQFFHQDGRNRWFDKSINLVVLPNGQAGINGEHSPCDAVVPGEVFNWVTHQANQHNHTDIPSVSIQPIPPPLSWHVDSVLEKGIEMAIQHAKELTKTLEIALYQGPPDVTWMKKYASPDAFVQMMLQRAYYLDQHQWTATYESASTRQFKHGRTECVRSCSEAAQKWVYAMDDPKLSTSTQLDYFKQAIAQHLSYMKKASSGKGCDRHLLGLRLMASDIPSIFSDPSYQRSSNFHLSTSNMSPGTYLYGGFGPVTHDGYGVNYAIGHELKFSVSSWNTSQHTHAQRFRNRIVQVFHEMKALFEPHA